MTLRVKLKVPEVQTRVVMRRGERNGLDRRFDAIVDAIRKSVKKHGTCAGKRGDANGVDDAYVMAQVDAAEMIVYYTYPYTQDIAAFALVDKVGSPATWPAFDTHRRLKIDVLCSAGGYSAKPVLQRVFDYAREQDIRYVDVESVHGAVGYYRRAGFDVRHDTMPTGGIIPMRKDLKATGNWRPAQAGNTDVPKYLRVVHQLGRVQRARGDRAQVVDAKYLDPEITSPRALAKLLTNRYPPGQVRLREFGYPDIRGPKLPNSIVGEVRLYPGQAHNAAIRLGQGISAAEKMQSHSFEPFEPLTGKQIPRIKFQQSLKHRARERGQAGPKYRARETRKLQEAIGSRRAGGESFYIPA